MSWGIGDNAQWGVLKYLSVSDHEAKIFMKISHWRWSVVNLLSISSHIIIFRIYVFGMNTSELVEISHIFAGLTFFLNSDVKKVCKKLKGLVWSKCNVIMCFCLIMISWIRFSFFAWTGNWLSKNNCHRNCTNKCVKNQIENILQILLSKVFLELVYLEWVKWRILFRNLNKIVFTFQELLNSLL